MYTNSNLYTMSNTKKLISLVIFITCIIILFFITSSSNSKSSDKFIGTIQTVKESTIIVSGSFEDEKKSVKPLYDYEIKVDSNTQIVKNSFVLPTGGEMFEMDKLPKETSNVDFDTLKTDSQNISIGIEVTLTRNILGGVQKKAKQIIYIGPKY